MNARYRALLGLAIVGVIAAALTMALYEEGQPDTERLPQDVDARPNGRNDSEPEDGPDVTSEPAREEEASGDTSRAAVLDRVIAVEGAFVGGGYPLDSTRHQI